MDAIQGETVICGEVVSINGYQKLQLAKVVAIYGYIVDPYLQSSPDQLRGALRNCYGPIFGDASPQVSVNNGMYESCRTWILVLVS